MSGVRQGRQQAEAGSAHQDIRFGPFRLIPQARRLERDGEPVPLGSRALDLLCLLASRPGEVVRKSDLMASAWPDLTVEQSSLRFHIAQLRRALGGGQEGERYVANVPGRGYCFVAAVQDVEPVAPPAPVPSETAAQTGLPRGISRLLGREGALVALADRLAVHRFVTIRGPGGIGKTTVAVALAHDLASQFPDGVRFLDLGSLLDPQLVPSTVARALGLLVPSADPTPSLIGHLRDRRMLLIFDSCEHVIEVAARLAESIHLDAPEVSLIATSREALRVDGEHVFDLHPLEAPPADCRQTAAEILAYPAASLFAERAAAAGYSAPVNDADARIVAKICQRLDGVALAIELVAGRVVAHGLPATAELLDGRLRLNWRGRRTAPPRHQTLNAALDWSYQLVSEQERALLRRLSVFTGCFTLDGARALAGGLAGSPDGLIDALEQLVSKSLVASLPEGTRPQFRLLDTTRTYALAKLAELGEAPEACEQHAAWVCEALATRESGPDAFRIRRRELVTDARAALGWAYSGEGQRPLRLPLAAACARLLVEENLLKECQVWAQRAIAELPADAEPSAAEVDLLWALGHALMFTEANNEESKAVLLRGLAAARALGDDTGEFRLLSRLHALYRRTGELRALLEVARQASDVAARIGDPAGVSRAQALLGVAHHLAGDQKTAFHHLRAAQEGDAAIPDLAVGHFAGFRGTDIMRCTNLWVLGLPDQALEVAERVKSGASTPDLIMYFSGLSLSALVFRWAGDLTGLEDAADRLANHAQKHGLPPFHAVAVTLKGQALLMRGALDPGVELLERWLPRVSADRNELYAALAASALAEGLAAQGRLPEALARIEQTIGRVAGYGESFDLPELIRVRGELRAAAGDLDTAELDFRVALDMADAHSALSWRLRVVTSLARHARGREARSRAAEDLLATFRRFKEGFETADLQAARRLLDELMAGAADASTARAQRLTGAHKA